MFSELRNKSVLIIGGAGFVGSNLARILLENTKDISITVVDNLLSSEKENLPNGIKQFYKGSVTDDNILSQLKDSFDYIFQLATYHGNQSSIHNPLADHANNTLTTLKLYDHIKHFKHITKIVYSSAGCSVAKKSFEEAKATTEEDPIEIKQDSPYSISKIIGEFYSAYYYNQHQLPIVRARFQNVYGPGEVLGAGQWRGTPATIWRNVTPVFIYKALHQQPLPVENNGTTSRDFIYVDDICKGLIRCALYGKSGDVYNLASGKEITILELARLINELTNNPAGINFLPKRTWDNSGKRFGSTLKSSREISFKADVAIQNGIPYTIEWTKIHLPYIQQCMGKHQQHIPA